MNPNIPMKPELILVIEDDAAILFGLRDNLQRAGYEVRSAGDGHQGLELARTLRPDLVLLDLMLPGLSGHEVCRRIRADGLEIPVVMLTALGEEAQVVRGLNLGADDYVTKPFGIGELMARWTNGRWKANLHRVMNPPADQAAVSRRLSLVFFHNPNYDAPVSALPGTVAAGEEPRYPPTTSGDHLRAQFVRTQVTETAA
jgi:DNA-binding response OmpR family regulator